MNLTKSTWTTNGDKIRLSVPFSKVDTERRIVSGFATLDNVDRQGDRITREANVKAFAESRRNLREMHDNIAAGRVVDFREETFFDRKTNKAYTGIYVDAYISTGAPNTWEKVLDGTLTGFSIGGNATEMDSEFNKDLGKSVRVIKAYDLVELSIVDNPANPLANVFSVTKAEDGGTLVKGMVAETKVSNLFECAQDDVIKASESDSVTCGSCDNTMKNIGWFEGNPDDEGLFAAAVAKHLSSQTDKGGVTKMSDATDNTDTSAAEDVNTDDVITSGDATKPEEEGTDKDADTTEADAAAGEEVNTDEEQSIEKMFDALRDSVQKTIEAGNREQSEAMEARITEFQKSYDERFTNIEKQFGDISKSLGEYKAGYDAITEKVSAMSKSTAVRKSAEDVESDDAGTTEIGEDGKIFKGAFLPLNGLVK